jgi:hypothetical protein
MLQVKCGKTPRRHIQMVGVFLSHAIGSVSIHQLFWPSPTAILCPYQPILLHVGKPWITMPWSGKTLADIQYVATNNRTTNSSTDVHACTYAGTHKQHVLCSVIVPIQKHRWLLLVDVGGRYWFERWASNWKVPGWNSRADKALIMCPWERHLTLIAPVSCSG